MSANRFDPTKTEVKAWVEFTGHMHRDGFIEQLRAAEERGRRRGVEERDRLIAALREVERMTSVGPPSRPGGITAGSGWYSTLLSVNAYVHGALAPRDSAPEVKCKHGKPGVECDRCPWCWSVKCPGTGVPRDSGSLSARDRAHAEDVADRYERGEFHCKCGKPITAEHPRCP